MFKTGGVWNADPLDAPLTDPYRWGAPCERRMPVEGLKLAHEMMAQAAPKPFVLAERLPAPGVAGDQDYFHHACRNASTDHLPSGACRMGADPETVVDPQLCFDGIAAFREADATVMPRPVLSNPNAATIMISEKAASMIRAPHGLQGASP